MTDKKPAEPAPEPTEEERRLRLNKGIQAAMDRLRPDPGPLRKAMEQFGILGVGDATKGLGSVLAQMDSVRSLDKVIVDAKRTSEGARARNIDYARVPPFKKLPSGEQLAAEASLKELRGLNDAIADLADLLAGQGEVAKTQLVAIGNVVAELQEARGAAGKANWIIGSLTAVLVVLTIVLIFKH